MSSSPLEFDFVHNLSSTGLTPVKQNGALFQIVVVAVHISKLQSLYRGFFSPGLLLDS